MVKKKTTSEVPVKNKKCRCIIKSHKGYCNETVRCPQMKSKSKHDIDPDELARKQYFELLCGLKGARQNATGEDEELEEDEEEEETFGPMKRIICHGRVPKIPDRSYVHSFLAEVWALLTPEMVTRLKEMLQTEFTMTPEEADKFIEDQKAKTILPEPEKKKKVKGFVVRRGRKCKGIRRYYSDQFNRIVSAKVADFLVASLSSRRTKNQRKISEFLLKNLCDVTGEKFTLQYPKTLAHKIMVFGTDTVAGWLAERVAEAEDLVRDDRAVEEMKAAKKRREKEKKREAKKQAKNDTKPQEKQQKGT